MLQGLNSHHSRWPQPQQQLLHPQTEAQIYQVPVDLEHPNYATRPLLNKNARTTLQQPRTAAASASARLSHSAAFARPSRTQGSPRTEAENLWLLQQNKFQELNSRPNSHIYMDLESSSSSEMGTTTTARKSLSNYVVSQC